MGDGDDRGRVRRMDEREEGCEGDEISDTDAGENAVPVESDKLDEDEGEDTDADPEDVECRFIETEGGCLNVNDDVDEEYGNVGTETLL